MLLWKYDFWKIYCQNIFLLSILPDFYNFLLNLWVPPRNISFAKKNQEISLAFCCRPVFFFFSFFSPPFFAPFPDQKSHFESKVRESFDKSKYFCYYYSVFKQNPAENGKNERFSLDSLGLIRIFLENFTAASFIPVIFCTFSLFLWPRSVFCVRKNFFAFSPFPALFSALSLI